MTLSEDLGSDTITDLATGDDLVVSSGATATANNVANFVADTIQQILVQLQSMLTVEEVQQQ